jgi:two-component system sensor histidine kinase YesM
MNKHFIMYLINQLNSISSIAAMEDASSTQREIIRLAEYIRYKFGRVDEIVKLGDEIDAVNNLVSLYKSRLGVNLNYTEDIVESSKLLYVPHYAVTTFIEYCLEHKFQTNEGIWEIRLTVKERDDSYLVSIEDNGEGNDDRVGSPISSIIQIINDYYHSQQNLVSINNNASGTTIRFNIVR